MFKSNFAPPTAILLIIGLSLVMGCDSQNILMDEGNDSTNADIAKQNLEIDSEIEPQITKWEEIESLDFIGKSLFMYFEEVRIDILAPFGSHNFMPDRGGYLGLEFSHITPHDAHGIRKVTINYSPYNIFIREGKSYEKDTVLSSKLIVNSDNWCVWTNEREISGLKSEFRPNSNKQIIIPINVISNEEFYITIEIENGLGKTKSSKVYFLSN